MLCCARAPRQQTQGLGALRKDQPPQAQATAAAPCAHACSRLPRASQRAEAAHLQHLLHPLHALLGEEGVGLGHGQQEAALRDVVAGVLLDGRARLLKGHGLRWQQAGGQRCGLMRGGGRAGGNEGQCWPRGGARGCTRAPGARRAHAAAHAAAHLAGVHDAIWAGVLEAKQYLLLTQGLGQRGLGRGSSAGGGGRACAGSCCGGSCAGCLLRRRRLWHLVLLLIAVLCKRDGGQHGCAEDGGLGRRRGAGVLPAA